MNAKQKAKWERWRRLGKRKFILLLTLLHVAISLVVFPIVSAAVSAVLFHEPVGMEIVVMAVFAGLIGGLLFGLFSWNSNERAYQDSTSRETSRTD